MNLFLTISLWVFAALLVWGGVRMVATVGKPKEPTTAPVAAGAVLIQAFFVVVVVLAALNIPK